METILQIYSQKKLVVWITIILVGLLLLLSNITVLASEIGGYISEKLIERSGVSNSSLVIGTTSELTQDSLIDVTMAPTIFTLAAQTTMGVDEATLRGNVADLKGFSSATVWFEWGYDTSYGSTVGTQTATTTGVYTTTISDFNLAQTVHYRFCTSADGTNYSSDNPFNVPHTPAGTLIWMIPTVFAIFGIVALFALRGKPVAIIVTGILVVIGVVILANIAGVLW